MAASRDPFKLKLGACCAVPPLPCFTLQVLSHEIAHVIHDHCGQASNVMAMSAGTQLVFLALLDPTGLLAFAAEVRLKS